MIVAGIGCRRGSGAAAILALLDAAEAEAGQRAAALAAPAFKSEEPGLIAAAGQRALPLLAIDAAAMAAAQSRCITNSAAAARNVGLSSVAEAAALAAAGPNATLLLPRRAAGGVTCALAGP